MELSALLYRGEVIVAIILLVIWRWTRYRLRISNIPERHVFISGCDSGFGRSLAERLHRNGVNVYAGCLLPSSVKELKEKYDTKMKPVLIDVTSSDSVRQARDYVCTQLSGRALWAVVNNAGISGVHLPFEWTSKKDCQKALDVNLLGVYDVTLTFLPLIKLGKEGRVVNVASALGRVALSLSGYTMSKYGVEAFSDGLSIELHPYNISVHTIEPGYFDTNITSVLVQQIPTVARKRWAELEREIKDMHGEEYLEKVIEYKATYVKRSVSSNVELVVDAYEHAILSKHPQNRYPVGNDMKYIFRPLSLLPFPWQFTILRWLQRWRGVESPVPNDALGKSTR